MMQNLTAQLTSTGRVDGLEPNVAEALSGLAASAGLSHPRRLWDVETGLVSVAVGTPVKPTVRRNGLVEWDGEVVGQVRRRGPGGKSGQWGYTTSTDSKAWLSGHLETRAAAVRGLTRSLGLF